MDPIIIIGATGGIGASLARRLHAAGRTLHLIGRDPALLAPLAAELRASRSLADVTDEAALAAAVGQAAGGSRGLRIASDRSS